MNKLQSIFLGDQREVAQICDVRENSTWCSKSFLSACVKHHHEAQGTLQTGNGRQH